MHLAPNQVLSHLVYLKNYSRWLPDDQRRETWPETVTRYIDFLKANIKVLPADAPLWQTLYGAILAKDIMPSMRALWSAGPAAQRDNICMYNCAALPIDCIRAFSDCYYIAMQSTGIGYSVQRKFTDKLPVVAPSNGRTVTVVMEDSSEGWAATYEQALKLLFNGYAVDFDTTRIRPAGSPLRTKGGYASGPAPFLAAMHAISDIFEHARGRKFRPLEVHKIVLHAGQSIIVGGVRRVAFISISDVEDVEMRDCKNFMKHAVDPVLQGANNSAYWRAETPDADVLDTEWQALVDGQSGERGIFVDRVVTSHGYATLPNPCGEINLAYLENDGDWDSGGGQFCNLTQAVVYATDNISTLSHKVWLATILGSMQATFTNFNFIRDGWKKNCERDRLLGVDLAGQCNNPKLTANALVLKHLNTIAVETADGWAKILGIKPPRAVTCGKPNGNSSQFLGISSGFHPWHAPFYLRRMQINFSDPFFAALSALKLPYSVRDASTAVFEFPIAAPAGALCRGEETALQSLERYKLIMENWCGTRGHNQSCTITYRPHEVDAIKTWLCNNWRVVGGLSFYPYSDAQYFLPPYSELTEEEYNTLVAAFPAVTLEQLSRIETYDSGGGAQELACAGGQCDLV